MSTPEQPPYSPSKIMLMLKAMSRDVHVGYSEYTQKWYVSARHLEIGDGVLLSCGSEHRDTPELAIQAFFDRLTSIGPDKYIVGDYLGQRREYQWNGATFAEVTRSEVLAEQLRRSAPSRPVGGAE